MEQDGRSSAYGEATDPSPDPIAWDQRVDTTPPIAGESLAATIAAIADPATRSPVPDTCPFLRTVDESGVLGPPFEKPNGTNRCVAVGEPTPQSARQQLHVCLTAGHSNCPRYLRGALVAADALAAQPPTRGPSTPVIASALLLITAAAMSVGFLLVRGGFDLPAVAAASQLAVASVPPAASPSPPTSVVAGSASPALSAAPTSSPPPSASPPPTEPPATPAPTPTPPAPTATPVPSSDRYALLEPCPVAADCWVYTVRPGDNLRSIVNYFGVAYDTVLDMNPQVDDPTNIHTGDEIRMPPPTR